MQSTSPTCGACRHFLASEKAGQRAVLEGFGYCTGAPTMELRARFFRADSACWLEAPRFAPAVPHAGSQA